MANNRLYIENTGTKERFFLAKAFARGWEHPGWTVEELFKYLETNDYSGGYGTCTDSELRLVTDSEPWPNQDECKEPK